MALVLEFGDVFWCLDSRDRLLGLGRVSGQFRQKLLQFGLRQLPLEGAGDCLVVRLVIHHLGLRGVKFGDFIGREDLLLKNGKVYLDLVKSTCMNQGVDLNRIGIRLAQPPRGDLTSVRRAVVGHPEHPLGQSIAILPHDQVHQTMVDC